MKYLIPLPAVVAAAPAFAHHEASLSHGTTTSVIAGLAVIALAGLAAWRQRRTA